ncbi:MAG: DUF87 domain-containing protein [Candidatus Diapherotrites archaeon]|nr:DUF87 domain-containing protein [Candidatus Diapherotrites archaeon]
MQNKYDHIVLNQSLNRVEMAVGYPRFIKEGWLNAIVASPGNFDVTLHIEPQCINTVLEQLNRELIKQRSDVIASESKGIVSPSLKLQYEDTYRMLENLQRGDEKLFNFSLYLNARAKNKQELELLSRKIESELNAIMIIPKTPYLKQQPALQSVLPLAQDKLKMKRNISSSALAACFPFTTAFLNAQEKGIMFGVNYTNNIPIILNPYTFANYNGLVLGSSGSGKSFFVKLYILRNLLNETKTFVIDPQGEYLELTNAYKGQIIEISRNSNTIINPLDLMGKDFGDKLLSLMDLFKIMFGELTEVQRSILDKSLHETYLRKGITPENQETWKKTPPMLKDLYLVLEEEEKKTRSKIQQLTYEALLNRLRIYAKGSFSFLNNPTKLNLEKNLITFNIKEMPEQVKPVIMFLILDYLYEKVQKNKERKLIVVDEAWSLLKYGEQAEYLFKICKTARKFGTGLLILTQEVNDLLHTKAGNSVLANTSWKVLLRQEASVIQDITQKFGLKQTEQNFILTSTPGTGLLLAMNDRIPIKIIASKQEHQIITTNPEELTAKEQLKQLQETPTVGPRNLFERNYWKKKKLTNEEIEILKTAGWNEIRESGFGEGKGHTYFVRKDTGKEGANHYLLCELIFQELKKYTNELERYQSVNPDIIFTAKNKRIAFEIETGQLLKAKKEDIQTKLNQLQKTSDDWYFVVTNKDLKTEYEKLGNTLKRTEVISKINELFA